MDKPDCAPRFDWIGWLATIPGVPADWGLAPPPPLEELDEPPLPLAA